MLLTVTVPEGLYPGDAMLVSAPDGQQYEICVPDGCFAGMAIDVDLPVDVPAIDETPSTSAAIRVTLVTLTVPDGLSAGMEMSVDWGGVMYNILVPDGVGAGQEISIELPSLEEPTPALEEPTPALEKPTPAFQEPPPYHDPTGPRTSHGMSPSRGYTGPEERTFLTQLDDAEDKLLSFMMDEMHMAGEDDGRPPSPPTVPLKKPPPPPPSHSLQRVVDIDAEYAGYRFRPGQRVHVMRSNGQFTLATVEYGYAMIFDLLYQVRTDDGLMKAAVDEQDMVEAPEAPPDPWAGFTDFMMGDDDAGCY